MEHNCFLCRNRIQGKMCPFFKECINGVENHFQTKAKRLSRGDIMRRMTDEDFANFIVTLRPDVEKVAGDLKEYILNWLKEETEMTSDSYAAENGNKVVASDAAQAALQQKEMLDGCWFLK